MWLECNNTDDNTDFIKTIMWKTAIESINNKAKMILDNLEKEKQEKIDNNEILDLEIYFLEGKRDSILTFIDLIKNNSEDTFWYLERFKLKDLYLDIYSFTENIGYEIDFKLSNDKNYRFFMNLLRYYEDNNNIWTLKKFERKIDILKNDLNNKISEDENEFLSKIYDKNFYKDFKTGIYNLFDKMISFLNDKKQAL